MAAEKEPRSFKAVQSRAARLRLHAMQAQLNSAFNYCLTAKNSFVLGQVQLGHRALEKARHTAQFIHAHLKEPNHVPADSVAGILDQLAELEKRISSVEAQLQS